MDHSLRLIFKLIVGESVTPETLQWQFLGALLLVIPIQKVWFSQSARKAGEI